MIIGINILFLVPNKVGGTEYYTRRILNYLEKIDKKNQYIIFCNQANYSTFKIKSKKFKKIECPITGKNKVVKILYEQFIFPFLLKKEKIDVIHSLGYFGPLLKLGYKHVVTIHDINWKDHPEDNNIFINLVLNFLITFSIIYSDLIITDSIFSSKRILYYFPKVRYKTKVVWPALEDDFFQMLNKKIKHPIEKHQFIFAVSAFYPHKRMLYLLDLWEKFDQIDNSIKLIIVGQNGKDQSRVREKIKLLNNVIWYKRVSFEKLISFYKYCSVFIFPSVYEGFGFPVYESVAAGKCALVSNKKLYHRSIHSHLYQLSYQIDNDIKLLKRVINQKKKKANLSISNEKSIRKLINLYHSLHY